MISTWAWGTVCQDVPVPEVGVEEAKLVAVPRDVAGLRCEARRFEEERGCVLKEVRGGQREFLAVCRMLRWAKPEARVVVDEGVREGHVVLVGPACGRC